MDLAQVGVQAHALHLQLLLDDLHLLLVGVFHQNAGDLALGGIRQLTKDHVLGMVQCTAVAAVEQLLLHESAVLFHGLLAHLLGKITVQGGQLTHAHVMQLDLEHDRLAGQLLVGVVFGEGDVDLELIPCLVAQNAVLETGDHAAAAQLHRLVLCRAALKGHTVQKTLKVHVHHIALYSGALVGYQLCGVVAAALQHRVDLLVGHLRGDALGGKAGGLGQLQLGLQCHGGGSHKALVLLHTYQIVAGVIYRRKAVFLQSSLVQSRHILIHQVVDGIVPEGVFAAVSFDLCAVGLALLEALDGISGAGALIDRIGGGLQFLSRSAEGHFADTLFRSFHAYQFHRIYPPCCSLGGGAALPRQQPERHFGDIFKH